MRTKMTLRLSAAFLIMMAAAGAAGARDGLTIDHKGDGRGLEISSSRSGDIRVLSRGDRGHFTMSSSRSNDVQTWALGDSIDGSAIFNRSEGSLAVFGMCPDGMRSQHLEMQGRAGLAIARCE